MHIPPHTHISTHGYCFFGSVLFTSLCITLMIVPKNYLTLTLVYFSVNQTIPVCCYGPHTGNNETIVHKCLLNVLLFDGKIHSLFTFLLYVSASIMHIQTQVTLWHF